MAGDPIIEFYIQNYRENNSVVTSETKFQTVPFSSEPVIFEPKVKNEMGKAGSFEFKMESTSPYYNALIQMKTLMRVTYFGTTIFRGRVLTIDKTMYGTRTVHCEGDFAFFLDSHQIGTEEDSRPTITVLQFLQQIINQHNSDMSGDAKKQFTLGEVPGQYTSATTSAQRVKIPSEKAKQKFGDTSWNTSMDRLESLLSTFGGYFRTRFVKGTGGASDVTYLDWYDKYYNSTTNTQKIEVAKNLIDVSGPTEVNNLFTIVLPIGRNDGGNVYISDYWPVAKSGHSKVNYITVPELATVPLFTDAELNADYHKKTEYQNAITNFGKIWKVVDFENANTPEKLFAYAKDWMKNNFMSEVTQWSVSALDLKFIDSSKRVLLCGDRVTLTHPEVPTTYTGMTIVSADYDLYNPDKNKYIIGIPNQQLNASYGVKVKSDTASNPKSSGSGGISSGYSAKPKPVSEVDPNLQAMKDLLQQQFIYKVHDGMDIMLDNPLAYVMYNTDGTEKTEREATASLVDTMGKFRHTKLSRWNELIQEAAIRGVMPNDPQLLIDFTPGEKTKQTRFKADAAYHFVNDYGLSDVEANVILNETAGESYLAGLVNDDGDWTDFAYSQGAAVWNPAMKDIAVETRKILQGYKETKNGKKVNNPIESLFGLDLNIDNYAKYVNDFEEGIKTFDVGEIFNTVESEASGLVTKGASLLDGLVSTTSEEKNKTSGTGTWHEKAFNIIGDIISAKNTEIGGKLFTLLGDKSKIDGGEGTAGFGSGGSLTGGWKILLNKALTYTANGHSYTIPAGSVAADDFHFTATYDSLKAKLLVVDTLLADYAQIGTLEALKAKVDAITSDTITANTWLSAANGYFSKIVSNGDIILNGSGIKKYKYQLSNNTYRELNQCLYDINISESNGVITVTCPRLDGSTAASDSFNMAATTFYLNAVAAARNGGWTDCYADINLNYTTNQTISPGGSITIYPACKPTPNGTHGSITSKGITVTASSSGGGSHDDVTGADIDLSGNPRGTALDKSGNSIEGWVWFKLSDGTWVILRHFSISKT